MVNQPWRLKRKQTGLTCAYVRAYIHTHIQAYVYIYIYTYKIYARAFISAWGCAFNLQRCCRGRRDVGITPLGCPTYFQASRGTRDCEWTLDSQRERTHTNTYIYIYIYNVFYYIYIYIYIYIYMYRVCACIYIYIYVGVGGIFASPTPGKPPKDTKST